MNFCLLIRTTCPSFPPSFPVFLLTLFLDPAHYLAVSQIYRWSAAHGFFPSHDSVSLDIGLLVDARRLAHALLQIPRRRLILLLLLRLHRRLLYLSTNSRQHYVRRYDGI